MTLLLAVVSAALPGAGVGPDGGAAGPYAAAQRPVYWQTHHCQRGWRSKVAYRRLHMLLYNHNPYVNKHKVRRYSTCVDTRAKAHHAHVVARRGWAWRHSYEHLWHIKWNRLPSYARSWTAGVSSRESGSAVGERSYYKQHLKSGVCDCWSFFQWMLPTWASACGCSTNLFSASWYHQAVVAWYWHLGHPTGQWPNTGE